ncbi:DNA replication complex GINS protein [Hortaea werneckii]|nr:DNA replication complex GINS protein [Hortaea werneckii]
MYAETANKLVLDAKRIQNLQHLPPYAATTVRAVTKEVRDLDREVNSLLAPYQSQSTQGSHGTQIKSSGFNPAEDPATACALLVNHLAMRRNKRCLLAYHRTRTDKLEEMCWSGADVAEIQSAATSTRAQLGDSSNLSADEEAYINSYSNLLAAYKGQWTDIDLTGSLEPPRDIFIDVRVLRDAGEIQTEYGSITLTKNSQFYVRQADVERLIQQGYLQKLGLSKEARTIHTRTSRCVSALILFVVDKAIPARINRTKTHFARQHPLAVPAFFVLDLVRFAVLFVCRTVLCGKARTACV